MIKHSFLDYVNGKLVILLILYWNNLLKNTIHVWANFIPLIFSHNMMLFMMLKSSWRLFSSPILTDYVNNSPELCLVSEKCDTKKTHSDICRLKWLHLPIWTGWSSATTMLICWKKPTSRNHSAQWVFPSIILNDLSFLTWWTNIITKISESMWLDHLLLWRHYVLIYINHY